MSAKQGTDCDHACCGDLADAWADCRPDNPGPRIMNVTINGYDAVTMLNIMQLVGDLTALQLSFRISAPTGRLNIKFTVCGPVKPMM
jgi:hypothetical protein